MLNFKRDRTHCNKHFLKKRQAHNLVSQEIYYVSWIVGATCLCKSLNSEGIIAYIGMTKWKMNERVQEHGRDMGLNKKSTETVRLHK